MMRQTKSHVKIMLKWTSIKRSKSIISFLSDIELWLLKWYGPRQILLSITFARLFRCFFVQEKKVLNLLKWVLVFLGYNRIQITLLNIQGINVADFNNISKNAKKITFWIEMLAFIACPWLVYLASYHPLKVNFSATTPGILLYVTWLACYAQFVPRNINLIFCRLSINQQSFLYIT